MNKWMKRLLVVFQIGGSFAGLVINLQYLVASDAPVASVFLGLIFTAIFVFGIVTGLVLIENESAGIVLSQIFMGIQIPLVSSPVVVYRLICGIGVAVFCQGAEVGFNYRFGCDYTLHLFREAPWGIGVNVVALVLFIYLVRLRRRKPEGDTTADRAEAEIQPSDLNPHLPE